MNKIKKLLNNITVQKVYIVLTMIILTYLVIGGILLLSGHFFRMWVTYIVIADIILIISSPIYFILRHMIGCIRDREESKSYRLWHGFFSVIIVIVSGGIIYFLCSAIRLVVPTEYVIDYGNSKTVVIDCSFLTSENYYCFEYGNFFVTGSYDECVNTRPMKDN